VTTTPTATDFKLGVAVAVVAALTALTDLGAGRLADDELIAVSERTNAFMWHQAKSIKEASAEGRHLTLKALLDAGALPGADLEKLGASVDQFHNDAMRLERDKRAILEGGTVDALELKGARWWSARADALGRAGDILDVALLLFHLALLLGGVGIASQDARLERMLMRIVTSAAALGVVIALWGALDWLLRTPH
jgi:hypothetical protein